MTRILKLVNGNAFDIRVRVVRKTYQQNTTGSVVVEEPIDLSASTDVKVWLTHGSISKKEVPYELGWEKGVMTVKVNETLAPGNYGIEVTGALNGEIWRYAGKPYDGFSIVSYTADGELTEDL